MNRIKINLPEHFPFSTRLQIRVTDLNYGGHVGNDTVLSILQEARQQFLQSRGYTELQVEGFGLIMADAMVEYKKEMNHLDQLKIDIAAKDFDKMGFDLYYRVVIEKNGEEILAVRAKTGMMLFDYTTRKKASMTDTIIATLQ